MRSLSSDKVGVVDSQHPQRFDFGLIAPWAIVGLIFTIEFADSLRVWQSANKDGLALVLVCSLIFLTTGWAGLLLIAGLFSWLLRKVCFAGKSRVYFALRIFGAAVVSAAWVFVVLNLATRRALGCFLTPSLIRFTYANVSSGFWAHTAAKYRWMMFATVLFLIVSTPMVFIKIWRCALRLRLVGNVSLRRPLLVATFAIVCAFTLSTVAINREEYKELKPRMVRHLCYKVEPVLAFSLGCVDLYNEMRNESRNLDEAALTPRSVAFTPPSGLADKPNIIFFQIESCRPDLIDMIHQEMEVTPNLNRLAREGTRFTRAYAPGTHTSLSNVSIPSSLCALRSPMLAVYQVNDPQPRTLICDVLKPLGYDTGWISSDFEDWAGMRDYLETPRMDYFIDATSVQGATNPSYVVLEPDTTTFTFATNWMNGELQKKHPFYLTLSLSDSHFPYDSSLGTNWFQPCGVPGNCSIFDYPESAKEQIRNTYLNAIRGIDVLLGQLMTFLREENADGHTIIVIYGDHGESFYENHILSHGNLPYDPSARTTLLMYGKGYFQSQVEDYPTSLIDIVPTVLARIGVPRHPNFQGIDVLSASRPPTASRVVYIHADGIVNGDGLVAGGRWKYFTDNGSGACYLYDLTTDPGELNNLVKSRSEIADFLAGRLDTYCAGQLAYYHSSRYYTRFYPPAPPQFNVPGAPVQQTAFRGFVSAR